MDELVMYIIVNSDVKMGTGKIAAQVAHSAVKSAQSSKSIKPDIFDAWCRSSYVKIVLKSDTKTMKDLMDKHGEIIRWTYDEGRTQIKSGSLTTLAFLVFPKDEILRLVPELKELKLL